MDFYRNSDLFHEVNKFREWAKGEGKTYGEWECNYINWEDTFNAFSYFIKTYDYNTWSTCAIEDIIYIIARNNEMEYFVEIVAEDEEQLLFLAKKSINSDETEAKWQFAATLGECKNREKALDILDELVKDSDEYVNRRALLAIGKQKDIEKTEYYSRIAWDRDEYDDQLYPRIAVLSAIFESGSKQLDYYLMKAREDGREYLVKNAEIIEYKQKMRLENAISEKYTLGKYEFSFKNGIFKASANIEFNARKISETEYELDNIYFFDGYEISLEDKNLQFHGTDKELLKKLVSSVNSESFKGYPIIYDNINLNII